MHPVDGDHKKVVSPVELIEGTKIDFRTINPELHVVAIQKEAGFNDGVLLERCALPIT